MIDSERTRQIAVARDELAKAERNLQARVSPQSRAVFNHVWAKLQRLIKGHTPPGFVLVTCPCCEAQCWLPKGEGEVFCGRCGKSF